MNRTLSFYASIGLTGRVHGSGVPQKCAQAYGLRQIGQLEQPGDRAMRSGAALARDGRVDHPGCDVHVPGDPEKGEDLPEDGYRPGAPRRCSVRMEAESWQFDLPQRPCPEIREIVELATDRSVGDTVIDVDVLVDEHVAKPGPTPHPLGQRRFDLARFLQRREGVPVRIRGSEAVIRYPVVGEIDRRFDREMQITRGQIVNARLREIFLLGRFTEASQPAQVAVQCVEPFREDLRIDHGRAPL